MCDTKPPDKTTNGGKNNSPTKLYIGIVFIISSMILGIITQVAIVYYFTNEFIRDVSVIVYIFSWFLLILGIAWAGKEYYNKYNYFSPFMYIKRKIKSFGNNNTNPNE